MSRTLDRRQAVAAFVHTLALCSSSVVVGCAANAPPDAVTTGAVPSKPDQSEQSAGKPQQAGSSKIALLLSLTGNQQNVAIAASMRHAAELALFDMKSTDLVLVVKDDKGTEAGARAAAEAAIADGCEVFIGPLYSKSVAAIAPAARKAGVPIIALSNNPAMAGNGVYVPGYTFAAEIERTTAYAATRGLRQFAALLPDDAEGRLFEPAFRAAVARNGGNLALVERFTRDPNGLVDPARRVAEAIKESAGSDRIEALFFPGGEDTLPQLDSLLPKLAIDQQSVRLLGTSAWDYPGVHRLSQLSGAWFAAPDPRGWREFSERFARTYAVMPLRLASLSHDAMLVVTALSTAPQGTRFTVGNLTRNNGFNGVDGAFRLLPTGLVERSLVVLELQKSGPVVVDAAPAAPGGAQAAGATAGHRLN